jgi:hypothetical protein
MKLQGCLTGNVMEVFFDWWRFVHHKFITEGATVQGGAHPSKHSHNTGVNKIKVLVLILILKKNLNRMT